MGEGGVDKHLGLQRKIDFHNTYINCTISKFDELEHISLLINMLNSWKFFMKQFTHIKGVKCLKCPLYDLMSYDEECIFVEILAM